MKSMLRKGTSRHLNEDGDDDSKSVRSSATTSTATALRMGAGFIKSKLHTPFKMGKSAKGENATSQADDDFQSEKGIIAENVNALNGVNSKIIPHDGDAQSLRLRLKEVTLELDGVKRKNSSLEKALESEQVASKRKISDLQALLEKERENYHSIATGGEADDIVRRQAETLQEYQALIDGLQMRLDLLQEEHNTCEIKIDNMEDSSRSEIEQLKNQAAALESENRTLKASLTKTGSSEESRKLEKECEMLRQRLNATETENVKLKKANEGRPGKGDSEKVRSLEQENSELKRLQDVDGERVSALQTKIISLERELSVMLVKAKAGDEIGSVRQELSIARSQLKSKDVEIEESKNEITKLQDDISSLHGQHEESQRSARELGTELVKLKEELSRMTQSQKARIEQDEHYKRAAEAARLLLKQKKISKSEFDQVMKAAQEAARVWNE